MTKPKPVKAKREWVAATTEPQEIRFSKLPDPARWTDMEKLFECKSPKDAMIAEHLFNKLAAENERYRTALAKIAKGDGDGCYCWCTAEETLKEES